MTSTPQPLTAKQAAILGYICKYIEEHGYPPAIRDIGQAFAIKSPNGVMCHLNALKNKGHIQRDEKHDKVDGKGGRARAITIPGVSAGGFSLPLLGPVAAGKAIEAIEEQERINLKDLFHGDNLYVLKVRGVSMIESQIADGDYVVIRKQEHADNGEKVVAMIDKAMTLKKFFRRRDQVRLEPCNSTMDPIIVDPMKQNVQILGILIGVIRKC